MEYSPEEKKQFIKALDNLFASHYTPFSALPEKRKTMPTMKERVVQNYEDHPLNKRNELIELEIGDEEYIKIAKYAKNKSISTKELIFMMIIDKINETWS